MAAMRRREADLAARWAAGAWRGAILRSEEGETFRVVFEGRRGGGAGPDFRDAVLARADGVYCYGDIELHLRPAGWHAHGHASDPRYNDLALHVVLSRSGRDPSRTALASGATVPLVVLDDGLSLPSISPNGDSFRWPCADTALAGDSKHLAALLHAAGMARFVGHATQLECLLHDAEGDEHGGHMWDAPNRVLWLTLAEALGYGRDRVALRRLGQSLLGNAESLEYADLPAIERSRAAGLLAWHARWGPHGGPWEALERHLRAGEPRVALASLRAALRVAERGAVSPGRADIVAVNVVLPFAAALGATRGDMALRERATALYSAWLGLPSNQIVREMARTLGLARLPRGALAQQGLHHLWQAYCREKCCARCPCNPGAPV
jgi:hypothetical protein